MPTTISAADDRSSLIQALTWFLFLAGFFSICARILTKYFLGRGMFWDDRLILAAEVRIVCHYLVLICPRDGSLTIQGFLSWPSHRCFHVGIEGHGEAPKLPSQRDSR